MAEQDPTKHAGVIAPIMPTGSGSADLEIAREQDMLAETNGDDVDPGGAAPGVTAADESEAHPS